MKGVLKYNNSDGWSILYLSEHEQKEFPLHPESIITVEKDYPLGYSKKKRVDFLLEILDYNNGYPDYIEYEVARIIEEKSETSNEIPLAVQETSQPSGILHYLDFQYNRPQETNPRIHENCMVMFVSDDTFDHQTHDFRRASLVIGKDENGNYTKILKNRFF